MIRVTASKTGLLAACGYFARPEAEWHDVTGPAADRGTRFHAAIAHFVETGDTSAVYSSDIATIFANAVGWINDFGRERLAAEVAFAWDPATDTAERIPAAERNYQAGHGRLCGTADLVAVNRTLRVGYVADWKTGDGSKAGPQLRTLALMLARAEGLDTVNVEALEVTDLGVKPICREELDAFALAAHAGELAEQLARVPTAEPVPGPHCSESYCPARATCPAAQSAIAELVPADALVQHRFGPVVTSGEHAAWMLDRVRLVEAACKSVKDAIKAACPDGGWQLEDGSVLAEGAREVSRFDKAKAIALCKELGATDEQLAGLEYTARESSGLRVSKPKRGRRAA